MGRIPTYPSLLLGGHHHLIVFVSSVPSHLLLLIHENWENKTSPSIDYFFHIFQLSLYTVQHPKVFTV